MSHFRPRLLSAVLPLVLSLSAASCTDPLTPPPDPGAVLFEVEYANFAWGRSWNGFVVEADGNVYAYDLSATSGWPSEDDDIPAAELNAKYAHGRRLVTAVPAVEAASRYARVADALAGSITAPQGVCADAGTLRYSALLHDESTGTYRRLLLHQRGDVARTNTSAAARELYRWLADVTSTDAGAEFCDPFG
jgi:hypothetical protein